MLVERENYIEQDGVSCKDVIVNFKGSFLDQMHVLLSLYMCVCVCVCVCVILSKKNCVHIIY